MTKEKNFMRPTAKDALVALVTIGALAALLAFLLYTVPSFQKAQGERQQQLEEILKY